MLFYARLEILRASGCRGSYFARVFGKLARRRRRGIFVFFKKIRNEYGVWELERPFAGIFRRVGDRLLMNGEL
jgi:hypothetical protein